MPPKAFRVEQHRNTTIVIKPTGSVTSPIGPQNYLWDQQLLAVPYSAYLQDHIDVYVHDGDRTALEQKHQLITRRQDLLKQHLDVEYPYSTLAELLDCVQQRNTQGADIAVLAAGMPGVQLTRLIDRMKHNPLYRSLTPKQTWSARGRRRLADELGRWTAQHLKKHQYGRDAVVLTDSQSYESFRDEYGS